jgi:hypothetical protein
MDNQNTASGGKVRSVLILGGIAVVFAVGYVLYNRFFTVSIPEEASLPPVEEKIEVAATSTPEPVAAPEKKPVAAPEPPAPKPAPKPVSIIAGVWSGSFTEAHICQDEYGPWTASITEESGKLAGALTYGDGQQATFGGTITGTKFNLYAGNPANPAFTLVGIIDGSTMAGTFTDYDPCQGSQPIVGAFSGSKIR